MSKKVGAFIMIASMSVRQHTLQCWILCITYRPISEGDSARLRMYDTGWYKF